MQQFIRHLILTLGFALLTLGILTWQVINFDLSGLSPELWSGLWPFTVNGSIHPIIPTTLGLAIIPSTLWEILLHHFRDSYGS
jgi:hypothetical protein